MIEVGHPIFSIQSIIWGDMLEYGTSAGQLDLLPSGPLAGVANEKTPKKLATPFFFAPAARLGR